MSRPNTPIPKQRSRENSLEDTSSEEGEYLFITNPKLQVVSARYEALRKPVPWKTRFVTSQLRQRVQTKGGGVRLVMNREFNSYFGDPCPGEPKQLVVVFRANDRNYELKWIEGSLVNIDVKSFSSTPRIFNNEYPKFGPTSSEHQHTSASENSFPHFALPVIMLFLDIYPDRFTCQFVCKDWLMSFQESGLTEDFRIGAPDIPGPCYLDQPASFVEKIVSKSKRSLKILNLDSYRALSDETMSRIFRMVKNLTHLDLSGCSQLTDKSIVVLATVCPNLVALTLKRVYSLTDASLVPIVQGCQKLERLDLSELRNVTDETLETIGMNLHSLRALYLRENHRVTNRGIATLCSTPRKTESTLKKKKNSGPLTLRKIKELSLCGLHRLTSQALVGFPIPSLRSLIFEGCSGLDDQAVEYLCLSASCNTLLSLNFRFCHKLTDRAVELISYNMKALEHLSLCYVLLLTDSGVNILADHLHHLRSLDVSHCSKITNSSICKVVQNLHFLSELRICSCKQFNDESVGELVSVLKPRPDFALNLLDARDCGIIHVRQVLNGMKENLDQAFSETANGCFIR